jgi:hypothetical protein
MDQEIDRTTVFSVYYRLTAASIAQSYRQNRNAQQHRGMNEILTLESSLLLTMLNTKNWEI